MYGFFGKCWINKWGWCECVKNIMSCLWRKKFSLTSIGFFFLTILVLTVLIQFLYEKSVLNITSESYKEKFEIVSDNSQSILENSGKIAKVILTDEAIQNWFLQDSEESADQLKYKMQVEKRLDYLDALYPDKQYSSISVLTHMDIW